MCTMQLELKNTHNNNNNNNNNKTTNVWMEILTDDVMAQFVIEGNLVGNMVIWIDDS